MFKYLQFLRSPGDKVFCRGTGHGRPHMNFEKELKIKCREVSLLSPFLNISGRSTQSSLRISADKKGGGERKKESKRKHNSHYRVFHWKQKTLISH